MSNGNLSAQGRRQGVSICPQQLTPPAKVLALCQLTKYLDLEFGFIFPTTLYLKNPILSALSRCPLHQRAPPLKEAVNRIPCTGTATPRSTTGCSQHLFHLLTLHRWPGWRGGGLANTRPTRRGTTVSSTLRWAKRFRRFREYEVDAMYNCRGAVQRCMHGSK